MTIHLNPGDSVSLTTGVVTRNDVKPFPTLEEQAREDLKRNVPDALAYLIAREF